MRLVKHTSQYEQWELMKESRSVLIWLVPSHSLGTQPQIKEKETAQYQKSLSSSVPSLSFSSSSPFSFPSSSLIFLPPAHSPPISFLFSGGHDMSHATTPSLAWWTGTSEIILRYYVSAPKCMKNTYSHSSHREMKDGGYRLLSTLVPFWTHFRDIWYIF